MLELAYRPDALLKRLRRPPRLSFALNGVRLNFANPEDLDFALAPRTALPLAKLTGLMEQTDELLEKEAVAVKLLSARLWEVRAGTGGFAGAREFLGRFGIQSITKDHDWRLIFGALIGTDDPLETYLKVAMTRFIDYLDSRHAAIQLILRQRHPCPVRDGPVRHDRTFGPPSNRRRVAMNFSA